LLPSTSSVGAPPAVALACAAAGHGRPVVLVHGWSTSSRALAPQAEALARGFRTLSVDLRGHGRSPAPASGYAIEDHAADLVALFDALDLDGAALVGWSLGAQVALAAAPQLGGRVAAVALLSGTPRFTVGDDWDHGLAPAAVRALALRVARAPEPALRRFFDGLFVPGELDDAARGALADRVLTGALPAPHAARAGLDAFLAADLRALAGAVRCPALLVHGEADPICLPGASRWLHANLPRARLALLPGLGHAPHLSRPSEVNALLETFLREATA
jgi:pimeloyl-[acyl-carrier protein] methyl ester esterase